jgi:hypothetical protein
MGDPPEDAQILARIGQIGTDGAVAVTDFGEAYTLADYLRRYTVEPIRFAWDVAILARILEDRFYGDRPGRLLEGLGKLCATNVKMYVHPLPREAVVKALGPSADHFRLTASAAWVVTADDLHPRPPVEYLYRYLREAGWVRPLSDLPPTG